ncbi:unnamed protein product [Bathycoccus prasinos]
MYASMPPSIIFTCEYPNFCVMSLCANSDRNVPSSHANKIRLIEFGNLFLIKAKKFGLLIGFPSSSMAAIGIFSQENFDPVSATSSGDRTSTKINPRPKVSFTSVTLIFAASASADAETPREDLLADDFGLVVFLNEEELLVENANEDD